MYNFSEPLKGLFGSSKALVLDFSKITSKIPDNENLGMIFSKYKDRNLNPRKPENRQLINNGIIDNSGLRYLIGQYGEDRTAMLADTPAGKEGRVIHMAVDIFSKELEPVFSPCDGRIIESGYEPGFGEYGNYVIIRPNDVDIYFFFGHLSSDKLKTSTISRNQQIARLGDYINNENGGWSRHLHIQVLTKLPDKRRTPDGYSSLAMLEGNVRRYPNPLNYFPQWKLQ